MTGLAASVLAGFGARAWERRDAESDFRMQASGDVDGLRGVLERTIEHMHSVIGLYESSEEVLPTEFASFVGRALERYPAIRSFGWVDVRPSEVERFAVGIIEGQSDEVDATDTELDTVRTEVLDRSLEQRALALSRPLTGPGQQVLAALPFLRAGSGGLVTVRLDVPRLVEAASAQTRLFVTDGGSGTPLAGTADDAALFQRNILVGDRSWTVVCSPRVPLRTATWRPWAVFVAGALVSLLLAQSVVVTTSRARITKLVAEQEVELEQTNRSVEEGLEERVRIEEERRRLELQLRQVIDLVPHMIFAVDDEGRMLLVNKAAAVAFGSTVQGLTGKVELDAAGPREWRDRSRAAERDVVERSRPQLIPVDTFVDADGKSHLLHTVRIPYRASVDGRPAVLCVAVDITERVQAEGVNSAYKRALSCLARGEGLDRVLTSLLESAEELVPGMVGSVLLLDETGIHLRHAAAPSLPAEYNAAVDGLAVGPGVGSCGAAAYEGRRVIVEDIDIHPNWASYRELAHSANLRACWSHPIFSSAGSVLGTLALYYREPRSPDAFELELIGELARLAGVAIDRYRAVEELSPG
ncbi:MAG: GAF domain-containing protein [bacterium]|nr:GAF domain-containing protein [bacterium]